MRVRGVLAAHTNGCASTTLTTQILPCVQTHVLFFLIAHPFHVHAAYCCGRSKSLLLCNQTDYTSDEPNISSTSFSATCNTPHRPPCPPPLTHVHPSFPPHSPASASLDDADKEEDGEPVAPCHVHLSRKVNPATFTTENHRK
jgi:hypothetical protein